MVPCPTVVIKAHNVVQARDERKYSNMKKDDE